MKPFFFLLTFLSLFSSLPLFASANETSPAQQPQQFINPIFNERLIAISPHSNGWDRLLTPTQTIHTKESESGTLSEIENCRIVGQTQTRILMECFNNKQQPYYDLYVSVGKAQNSMDCQYCHIVHLDLKKKIDLNDLHPESYGYEPYHVLNDDCGPVEKDPRFNSSKK